MKNTKFAPALSCLALALAAALPAHAATADDISATKTSLQGLLSTYGTQANALAAINTTYTTYQWAQPYLESSPGNGNWASIAMSNGDAEKIVGIANTRCGQDDTAVLSQISSALGASAATDYQKGRGAACQALQVAAQMLYRYSVYQNYKVNGYKIWEGSAKQEFRFDGKYHRTVQMGASFMFYPDVWDTATNGFSLEDRLTYKSWFKFSDNDKEDLNIVEKLRSQGGGGLCIPLVKGGGASASICMANLEVKGTSSVSLDVSAKLRWSGENKTVNMGRVTLPAPFGYLDEVAQMKDNAKQDVMNRVKSQVVAITGVDQQTLATLQKLASLTQVASK
jgi:hypothetical protein